MIEKSNDAAEILETAAEILERDGWVQDTWTSFGRRCMVSAVNRAVLEHHQLPGRARGKLFEILRQPALDHLNQAINGYTLSSFVGNLTAWNDLAGRTKQEVLDVLHKAAKTARGGPRDDAA